MHANFPRSSDNLRKFNAKRWGATILSQAPTLPNVHYLAAGSTGSHIMRHATQPRISPKTICGALLCALVISASFTCGAAQLEGQAQRSLLQSEPHEITHCTSNSDEKHNPCPVMFKDANISVTCGMEICGLQLAAPACLLACCSPGFAFL